MKINVISTCNYFNLSREQLATVRNEYGYTKEDCLILDEVNSELQNAFYTT